MLLSRIGSKIAGLKNQMKIRKFDNKIQYENINRKCVKLLKPRYQFGAVNIAGSFKMYIKRSQYQMSYQYTMHGQKIECLQLI